MLLARALLARGERATVETYLEDCKSLWLTGAPTLDGWLEQIRQKPSSRLRRESRILTKKFSDKNFVSLNFLSGVLFALLAACC